MKTLIILALLGIAAFHLTQQGPAARKSRKLPSSEDVKVPRSSAHALIKRHKRAYDYYERFYPRIKSPMEVKQEQCENYWPCDQLSEWVGFHQAYQTYFGTV
ncbi:osteocalcin-like [Pyxicephalus adspersus]|uniref:osteocalcin-like n=1 Tax=Pyxicephalus adspersus TaxID=30357 RepID=UPI003B5909C2